MKSPRLTNCRKDSDAELKPGDMTWVKLRGFSWWPAQVVDEKSVSENYKPHKKMKRAVLLRLYGSYEYVYHMEPMKSLLEFKNILKQQNCSCRDMLQNAIDQARLNSSSDQAENSSDSRGTKKQGFPRKSSKKAERFPGESSKKVERVSSPSEDSNKRSKRRVEQDDARTNNKCDIPDADLTAALDKSPELSARRLKVMQSLGLVAPTGSPFFKGGHIQAAA